MKRLQGNLTYANVMATIAVFLVLAGGTALAATQVLPKNSVGPRQLKKGAVTPAKLSKASELALRGSTGETGPQGPKGAGGAQGEPGPRGERGEPGPAVLTLPSGQTETGVFATGAPKYGYGMVQINFVPRLQQGVPVSNEVFLQKGATSAACPGNGRAAPGFLCVYEGFDYSMDFENFSSSDGSSSEDASATGVIIYFESTQAGGNILGNWAYTAQ